MIEYENSNIFKKLILQYDIAIEITEIAKERCLLAIEEYQEQLSQTPSTEVIDAKLLKFVEETMDHYTFFVKDADILILSYQRAKAILELEKETGFKEYLEETTDLVNLSFALARALTNMDLFDDINPEEITEENMRKWAEMVGTTIENNRDE